MATHTYDTLGVRPINIYRQHKQTMFRGPILYVIFVIFVREFFTLSKSFVAFVAFLACPRIAISVWVNAQGNKKR